MNKKIILIMTINFYLNTFGVKLSSTKQPIIISLGRDCETALFLRKFNLRKAAYPFDWIRSEDFNGVCLAITEKFAHFLDHEFLQYKDYIHEARVDHILNTRYLFHFLHDFPTTITSEGDPDLPLAGPIVPNYLDFTESIQQKYSARINRFFKAINGNERIIFMRTHCNPQDAKNFTDLMNQLNPKLDYLLIVIHAKKENNYDWQIPNVTNFFLEKDSPHWYNDNQWQHIFNKYGILKFQSS